MWPCQCLPSKLATLQQQQQVRLQGRWQQQHELVQGGWQSLQQQ
jgi:hypothetical protein